MVRRNVVGRWGARGTSPEHLSGTGTVLGLGATPSWGGTPPAPGDETRGGSPTLRDPAVPRRLTNAAASHRRSGDEE